MSSFTPLTRNSQVNDRLLPNEDTTDEEFTMLTKSDKTPSFSYSLERISRNVSTQPVDHQNDGEFAPLTRALSFAHKGLGISQSEKSSKSMTTRSLQESINPNKGQGKVVCVVDTFSTGALVADSLIKQGYRVIRAISGDISSDLLDMVLEGLSTAFIGTVTFDTKLDHAAAVEDMVSQIDRIAIDSDDVPTSKRVEAVIAGAETGVEVADAISERLGVRTNGTAQSECRRNKYLMGETIRQAGIRAVKQIKASTWEEIDVFLNEWNPSPFKVIIKPIDSAGSDGVTLCHSKEEVQRAFDRLIGHVNGLGLYNKSLLVQEYLEGQEYVIDIVSRDGEHKVVAIWEYDRREVNGASFVCFGQRLLSADEPRCTELMEYQKRVITALGIRNGPTHGEVKWYKDEPVLVEVGARCHGGEGAWCDVASEVFGYNQAQVTIHAYLDSEAFEAIPWEPRHRRAFGFMKWICVTNSFGTLREINPVAVEEIMSMESYRGHQFFVSPGDYLRPTIDCFTWAGCSRLVNKDADQVLADYKRFETIESSILFSVE